MNDPRHSDRLLSDVFGEGVSADFRAGLLEQTLRLARRRRRVRQVRAAVPALALLAVFALLVRHHAPPVQISRAPPAKPYTLVRTRPLPPAAWIASRPLSPANIIASAKTDSIILTAKAEVRPREINDDELLALLPKPAALVRHGPHSAELIFVNQEDREELLRN